MENFRIVINHAALNSGLIDAVNLTERGIDHRHNHDMKSPTNPYAGFRFPTEIIRGVTRPARRLRPS